MQRIDDAFAFVRSSMSEMLETARQEGEESRNDLLSLLSRSNQRSEPLSEEEAIADVWMFCLAGMETSAHTIGWLIMRLSFLPELQTRLFQEVSQIDGVTDVASDNAPLLYSVIYETLRLHPPANTLPLLTRIEQKVGDVVFEKGWIFNLNVDMIQLNPR